MTDVIITAPDESVLVTAGVPASVTISNSQPTVEIDVGGLPGSAGPQGPPGESGTMIVTVPLAEWPPADPQPNTLYLKLA